MPFVNETPKPWLPWRQEPCRSTEHYPPAAIVLEPGPHTWQCPECGQKNAFQVPPRPMLQVGGVS